MSEDKAKLSHVLWIGGATDAGKTTVARILAGQHALPVYHYDRHDLPHHVRLAESEPVYRHFLDASLDERWVIPAPPALLRRSLRSFHDRFPLIIEDLLGVASGGPVIAEGFGLLPALVAPLLSTPRQAIWGIWPHAA